VAILWNAANPSYPAGVKFARSAAGTLGVQLQLVNVREPDYFDGAFVAMTREHAGAVLVMTDPVFIANPTRLLGLVGKSRLPAMFGERTFTEAGGLMNHGVNPSDNFRRAATYVDKILKGARPADLPIEQPTRFELVINLRTAKALGLKIPESVLLRARQLIE
jgi:ABC-type uncharacterized transport system substrate-binding protein